MAKFLNRPVRTIGSDRTNCTGVVVQHNFPHLIQLAKYATPYSPYTHDDVVVQDACVAFWIVKPKTK